MFQPYGTTKATDFSTTSATAGSHQFFARVRSQGTTKTFTSNTLTTAISAATAPCTAVSLDTPVGGAVVPVGAVVPLHATATCPAGVTPEYQFSFKRPADPLFTLLAGFGLAAQSFTPAGSGAWVVSVATRATGSSGGFQAQSAPTTFTESDAPHAVDDTLTVAEDRSGTVNVLANDSDPNGDTLTATITTAPTAGTATIAGGVVTYNPTHNFHGSDAVTYTANDGHGNTATATLHITVTSVNDPPAAEHDLVTIAEDSSATLDPTLNDSDVDGDALTVMSISTPTRGTATVSGNLVTYTPAHNFHGSDAFQYTVSDGHGGSSTASVFVTVTSVDDPPTAVDDALTVNEDTAGSVYVLGNDGDVDGDTLAIVGFTSPAHGTATLVAGLATYRPAANYHGTDAFSYTVSDPTGEQSTATVHVTVTSVNDVPVAVADSAALDEGTGATIDVTGNDSDADGDPLAVTSITQPAHGTATIADAGHVTYVPAAGYHGTDALTYTISDGQGGTATATVSLTVANRNDDPIAVADAASLDEDTSATLAVTANDSDPDGDPLTITAITQPAHGTAAIVDATHVGYTPAANYHGLDAFTYTVDDGQGGSATASVTLSIGAVNDAPIAADDAAELDEDTGATIDVAANDSDLDGDALAIASVTQPAHGTAAVVDATHVSYTPAANYHGTDAFTYTISDGHGGTATATVALTIASVNDAPAATDDLAALLEDGGAVIDVVANDSDADGDALSITAITQPAHGVAVILDATHVGYTPAANYHGTDGFSYTIADPSGATASAAVALVIASVNDAPIAADDAASLDEDTAVTTDVVGNDFDLDGDALSIVAITQPAHGVASLADAHRITYTPAPNFHGTDAVSYTISDGNGGTASAVLALTVASVNDAPVAADDAASLDEDTSATIDVAANDSDADGDVLSVFAITQPSHGTAALADATHVSYTPAADYHGADAFTYTISDGHGATAIATVTLSVASVNDAPVAVADTASLDEDTVATIAVTANDSDVDGDSLTVIAVTAPAHGSAAIADAGHVSYTPAANFHGSDAFSYTISDGNGATATAAVALTIASVNDAPIAAPLVTSTFDDTAVALTLAASDADGDPLTFAIASSPAHGTLSGLAGNHLTYTPAAGYAGSDGFTFTASDGQASSTAAATITVIRSVCGNGVREGREECDDGNTTAGDGCEPTCKLTCGSGTGADRATVDPASGHCFAAYDGVTHSYQQAAAMCAGVGGHLPTLTSAGEDAAAFAAVHAGDRPWIGADDLATEGTMHWTTGEPVGYLNFAAGKPDNAGNADCVHYLGDGTWTDASCASSTGTLCELELAAGTPVVATGGAGTRGVVIADLNGDGYPDVATTNQTANSVGVLLGNGAGGFVLTATYPVAAGPIAIVAGDFDADGHVDLAVVGTGALTVLHGSAAGTFTPSAPITVAAGPVALAATDLDGDGALDLVVGATATLQLWHGNGAGGFALAAPINALSVATPTALAAGDFDRDGHTDLAITTASTVVTLRGTGGGAFAAPVTLATQALNRAITAADLDGDGNLDLAVGYNLGNVAVWFGSATGAFGTPIQLTLATLPLAVSAGDFDGDGGTDLAAIASGFATVFHRAGRTFTAQPAVATGGAASAGNVLAVAAGNLNGDAAQDLIVTSPAGATVGILLGGTGGTSGLGGGRALPLALNATASSSVSADFNADGLPDLAVCDPGTSKVYVFLGTPGGGMTPSGAVTLTTGANPTYAVAADFDSDGKLDLAIVNVAFSSISVALGAGNGTFAAPINAGTAASPRRIAVGDFNGDGKPDLAVPAAVGNAVTTLINAGGGRFGRLADIAVAGGPIAVVVGDFNGDTRKDLAIASSTDTTVKLLLGTGTGGFTAGTPIAVGAAASSIAAGDLDGDGVLDLITTQPTTNNVSILRGLGAGGFAAATTLAVGGQPSSVVAVDLDGDAHLDLVVGNAGTGDVSVLHATGAGGFVTSRIAAGGPVSAITVADLDHDGHLDITAASGGPFVTTLFSAR